MIILCLPQFDIYIKSKTLILMKFLSHDTFQYDFIIGRMCRQNKNKKTKYLTPYIDDFHRVSI